MSNPNDLLSQKLWHYLNQGRTLNDIIMRATHWMTYFDLSKLNLKLMYWKHSNHDGNGNRCAKVALRTTCIKNVKFKIIIKIRIGCQYVGYFYYSQNLNWAAQNLWLGRMRPEGRGLDIADLNLLLRCFNVKIFEITNLHTDSFFVFQPLWRSFRNFNNFGWKAPCWSNYIFINIHKSTQTSLVLWVFNTFTAQFLHTHYCIIFTPCT